MSSASPPRTSPTISRSGRMRSAVAHELPHVTAPAPSAFAGRASEPDDVGLLQAELGGLLDGDDAFARVDRLAPSALHNVVLPALVAPATSDVPAAAHERGDERGRGLDAERIERRPAGDETANREARTVGASGGSTA